jgi:zinc transport system substrate-binding protein
MEPPVPPWSLRLLIALSLLLAWVPPAAAGAAALRAFVSVAPEATLLRRIAGDRVEVRVMVQPGQDPHTYEPTPRQVADLTDADLYLRIGMPFEAAWIPRIRAANPRLEVLDLRRGVSLKGRADLDPHLWTSPRLLEQMGRYLRDHLARRDPAGAARYWAGYAVLAADLDTLDRDIRATLAGFTRRTFLVFHPAWGHFAAAYGLTQLAIERQGKEPGAKALGTLIDQAQALGIRVVFVQPQMDRRAARTLADAIGARVEVIDPLAADYFANLRRVAHLIAGALGP